jgi:hypothetical protein
MADIEIIDFRLLLNWDGTLYKLARIVFSKSDVSFYIIPYAPDGGTGFAGQMMIPAPGQSNSVNFSRQLEGLPVRVSIHESGRCHAAAGTEKTQPAWGRSLFYDEIAHIATVLTGAPTTLPVASEARGGSHPDIVFTPGLDGYNSVHVPLFVCPDEATAKQHVIYVTLARPGKPRPLYLALGGRIDNMNLDSPEAGVVVMAGWGPGNDPRPLNGIFAVTTQPKA